jgi:hypothetical protein
MVKAWLEAMGTEYESVDGDTWKDKEGNEHDVDWDTLTSELAEAQYSAV